MREQFLSHHFLPRERTLTIYIMAVLAISMMALSTYRNESSYATSQRNQSSPNQGDVKAGIALETAERITDLRIFWIFVSLASAVCLIYSIFIVRCLRDECRGNANELVDAAMIKHTFHRQADEMECAICLSEFETGQALASLRCCGHSYHEHCIKKWLSVDVLTPNRPPFKHTTCPLCKRDVRTPTSSPAPLQVAPAVEMSADGDAAMSA